MLDEKFVDGIQSVGLGKGAVRIDFFGAGQGVDAKNQPVKELRQRIIMTTESFVESFNTLQGVMKRLVDAGVVKPQPQAGDNKKTEAEGDKPTISPNF